MNVNAIGIDLGGTRIKAVILDQSGAVIHQQYSPTQDGEGEGWKIAVLVTVNELKRKLEGKRFVIGISAPGISNEDNTAIAHMPGRLDGLENLVWSELLQQQTWVLNDAVAALMAESRLGIAQKRKHAILLTLGTGVGGAILIDEKPYQGAFQKAGHLGHCTVNEDGDSDITGIPGSLEDAIGNATVSKRSLGRYSNTHDLLEAYRKGDHFARWVWLSSVRKLAIGIASFTNILSPQCVVLSGGITEAGKDLFEPLDDFLALYEWRTGGNKTEILRAQFGDMAGATGAACFALEKLASLSE